MNKLIVFLMAIIAQTSSWALTGEEALQSLKEGNARFLADRSRLSYNQTGRRSALADSQKPFAIILGCSDSRVPPEILFDQGLGDLFIIRVAGNVLGPSEIDSITYAVKALGCQLIVVLGHENCGAVEAVWQGQADIIPYVKKEIKPALDFDNPKCQLACQVKRNVSYIVKELKGASQFATLVKNNDLQVVGAYYPFVSGKVEFLK